MRPRWVRNLSITMAVAAIGFVRVPRPAGADPPVTFTHGVASGDVTPFSAVLWTRVDQGVTLAAEVSPDPDFAA